MGTQQILLIVLSVIIVGIAVAVGITMFNAQAVNSNRSACISDMNNFASQAQAYYKTPVSHGGCGSVITNYDAADLIAWIGMPDAAGTGLSTGNGSFAVSELGTLATADGGTGNAVAITFTATGNETDVDSTLQIDLVNGGIKTVSNPAN